MFGRIQNIDNRVLDNISRIHKPALNKIMITASRAGNAGIVWWAVCLPFLINSNWRATGANFVFGLAWAHLMGEIIIKHIVKRVRPCHTLDDDEQLIDRPRFYSFPSGHTTASFAMVGVALMRCKSHNLYADSYACNVDCVFKNLSACSLPYGCYCRYDFRLNLRNLLCPYFQYRSSDVVSYGITFEKII